LIKFAESRRAKNFAVKGFPAEPGVRRQYIDQGILDDGFE
jgi:hypothetical protein